MQIYLNVCENKFSKTRVEHHGYFSNYCIWYYLWYKNIVTGESLPTCKACINIKIKSLYSPEMFRCILLVWWHRIKKQTWCVCETQSCEVDRWYVRIYWSLSSARERCDHRFCNLLWMYIVAITPLVFSKGGLAEIVTLQDHTHNFMHVEYVRIITSTLPVVFFITFLKKIRHCP